MSAQLSCQAVVTLNKSCMFPLSLRCKNRRYYIYIYHVIFIIKCLSCFFVYNYVEKHRLYEWDRDVVVLFLYLYNYPYI